MIRTVFKVLALSLFGIVFSLGLLEIGVRLSGFSASEMKTTDTKTGLRTYEPNSSRVYRTSCYENVIETNNLGFHAYDYPRQKPSMSANGERVKRIVVIGDSFTEAVQVTREELFTTLLQKTLNALSTDGFEYEVIPFGVNGNGSYANLQYLAAYGLSFEPDLVIDMFTEDNDPANDAYLSDLDAKISATVASSASMGTAPTLSAKQYLKGWTKKIVKKSALVIKVYSAYLGWKSKTNIEEATDVNALPLELQVQLAEMSPVVKDAWERQEKLLKAMRDLSTKNNAKFLVVSIASGSRIHDDLRTEYLKQFPDPSKVDIAMPGKVLQDITARNEIPYLALYEGFREKTKTDMRLSGHSCDLHWNQVGHSWANDIISSHLLAHPELLPL
ncbi:MAG: hypothetical protein WC787_02980 [Patescibacteria group bacterium]|jgi:hypothetical protein